MYTFKGIYHLSQFPDLQEDGSIYLEAFFHKRLKFCQCHYKVPPCARDCVLCEYLFPFFFSQFYFHWSRTILKISNYQLRRKCSEEQGELKYDWEVRESVYGDTVVQPLHFTDKENPENTKFFISRRRKRERKMLVFMAKLSFESQCGSE